MAFEKNVFVNCPFDARYLPLLRPLLFTVIYLDLAPRISLEAIDSGELRLNKIVELIRESKYSIHDLSRCEAAAAGELYRLNMPFELGIDFGCRTYGRPRQRGKRTLVLCRANDGVGRLESGDSVRTRQCTEVPPQSVAFLISNST